MALIMQGTKSHSAKVRETPTKKLYCKACGCDVRRVYVPAWGETIIKCVEQGQIRMHTVGIREWGYNQ